ncbi:hypothetical protein chiPu_0033663, partial [Chiloscyllium punctatum]|nr:hypothetical protein [Chiloscyllium punctatum]
AVPGRDLLGGARGRGALRQQAHRKHVGALDRVRRRQRRGRNHAAQRCQHEGLLRQLRRRAQSPLRLKRRLSRKPPNKDNNNGPPALSRSRPGRPRVSRHAQAQHQPAQAAGELTGHGTRLQWNRRLHPLQEQARPAIARACDPAGRLAGEVGI